MAPYCNTTKKLSWANQYIHNIQYTPIYKSYNIIWFCIIYMVLFGDAKQHQYIKR